ncbi:hypothetical protein KM043_003940 [Ampulex compressa]|nr:hypothetical protein KM043_003940 [Ampulex compressa]
MIQVTARCAKRDGEGKIAKLNGGNTVMAEACTVLIMQHIEIGFARLRGVDRRTGRPEPQGPDLGIRPSYSPCFNNTIANVHTLPCAEPNAKITFQTRVLGERLEF